MARAQSAQDLETARELFKQANGLRDTGDLRGALPKYKAAHELGRTPVTGLALAKAYVGVSMLTEARETLLSIANIPTKPNESENTRDARAEAAQLADALYKRIPSLTLFVDGVPEGQSASVTLDGEPVSAVAIGIARRLNPGPHTLVATVGGGPESRASVTLVETEARTLRITVQPPLPPPTTPPPVVPVDANPITPPPPPVAPVPRAEIPAPSPSTAGGVSTAAFVIGGAGLAGLLVAGVTGGLAMSKKSDVSSHCNAYKQCDQLGLDAASSGATFATVSTVAAIVGGVGLATGIVLAVVGATGAKDKGPSATLSVSPLYAGGEVRFGGTF